MVGRDAEKGREEEEEERGRERYGIKGAHPCLSSVRLSNAPATTLFLVRSPRRFCHARRPGRLVGKLGRLVGMRVQGN